MKRLSIKNVEFSERMSEETNCFVADVYLDGKKFAYAKNSGHGGSTDVSPYPETRDKFKEAEAYAKSLPAIEVNDDFKIDMNLEHAVDELFEVWLKEMPIKKHQAKCLVLQKGGSIYTQKLKSPVKELLKHGVGRNYLILAIGKAQNDGYEILNTNLEELYK